MPSIDELAGDYVRRKAGLDPVWATAAGLPGFDDRFGDYSPDGVGAMRALNADTLTDARKLTPATDAERIAADLMAERLSTTLDLHDAEWYRSLDSLGSPLQSIRRVFDLMPTTSEDDWRNISARLDALPATLEGYRRTLDVGRQRGATSGRRQVETCMAQAAAFAGTADGVAPFTTPLLAAHEQAGSPLPSHLLHASAERAAAAFDDFRRYLAEEYLPDSTTTDGVGRERYARFAAYFTGASLDLDELVAWGWDELARVQAELRATAHRIIPDASLGEVVDALESDPRRSIAGGSAVVAWLQDLLDRTMDDLDGRHFDIPDPIRRLEVRIAPPGGPPVAYYTGPSEDFRRPGRYWFPAADRTQFPLWQEVSIAYHEGVPGHHLEIATQQYQRDRLTRFQTTTMISGYSEGWALYAERLMDELGYLSEPAYRLGMLAAQAFRAMRVVVDTGLHLGLTIPAHVPEHGGRRWSPDLAKEFIGAVKFLPDQALVGEITRYLGLPAQAISYKVGERVWRRARDTVARREGSRFSLAAFHARALSLGTMGLDQLERELTHEPGDGAAAIS